MTARTNELRRSFGEHFGDDPGVALARAPGRVNLIGDHTDYNGLPVLPMAIQREIKLIFRPRADAAVRLRSADDRFPDADFEISRAIPPAPNGAWSNYPKAAAQVLVERLGEMRGLDGLVVGDVPVASGLSSSSALVVATAIALIHGNGLHFDRDELMEVLARGERYVGTQGGGMDQAISLGGKRGHAVKIEFEPLRLHAISVPADWRFIVASSLVPAAKSGEAREAYNLRTRECAVALEGVGGALRPSGSPNTYADLVANEPIGSLLRIGESVLEAVVLKRFRHVVTEAHRVEEADGAMRAGELHRFGNLMDESHRSLRDDYEVSCVELNQLCAVAKAHGAAGARLTGAGFGGCVVILCDQTLVAHIMGALREEFYAARLPAPAIDDNLFVALPSDGASVRDTDG